MIKQKISSFYMSIKSSKNPIKFLISKLFIRLPFLFKFLYFKRKNYKLRFSSSAITASMFVNGENNKYDNFALDEEILFHLMEDNKQFIDVGANIGHLSIFLKKSFSKINSLAIEANPKIFNILCENIYLNKLYIPTVCCALSYKDNEVIKFQDSFSDDGNSVISKKMEKFIPDNDLYLVKSEKTLEIKTKTLDTILRDQSKNNQIRLIKVDTEGYELFVFKGATETLKKTEMIYFECWDKLFKKYDYKSIDVFNFLYSSGFEIYKINEKMIKSYGFNKKCLAHVDINSLKNNQNLLAINKNYNVFI